MKVLFIGKKQTLFWGIVLLATMLLMLQFSSLRAVSAQEGGEDGGEAGYLTQPGPEAIGLATGVSVDANEDDWSTVEAAAPVHASETAEQNAATPTLTLNTGHFGHFDDQGQWVNDPTVTVYGDSGNQLSPAALQEYQQAKGPGGDPTLVTFRSGVTIRPQAGLTTNVSQALQSHSAGGQYYFVQFDYPFPGQARERLEAVGVKFYDNVGPNGFYVYLMPAALTELHALVKAGQVRHVGQIPMEAKVAQDLLAKSSLAAAETQKVTLLTFETPTTAQLSDLNNLMTVETRSDGAMHIVEGTLAASNVIPLANLNYVRWIESQSLNTLFNLEGGMTIGSDVVRGSGGAYDGTDVNVMVVDTGIARSGSTYHPDLPGARILDQWDYQNADSNASDDNSHGTHVAGTIGGRYSSGSGFSNRNYQGVAPDVDLYVYKLCCDSSGLGFSSTWVQSSLQRATSGGRVTHISSNSWGGGNGTYNTNSEIFDRAVRGEYNSQRINMVVAAGNDNALTSSPGSAKNAITVGAVKDGNYPDVTFNYSTCSDNVWPPAARVCFSNKGPINIDGDSHSRVKPDVMAPGIMTTSARPWYLSGSTYYGDKAGTSMATPHVSGAVAQILDAYSASNSWLWSWPETIKALLLATATDVGNNTSLYGRGLINPYHAIYSQSGISNASFWGNSISSGQTMDFTFTVPSGYRELRVVLTWTDPAGTTEVAHDLDIQAVYDPGNVSRGSSLTFDDTVEYVTIPAGYTAGTWRIRVKAYSLSSAQRFGLAVHQVLANAALNVNPTAEYIPASNTSVEPSDYFYLHQYVSNSGLTASGSYARLSIPTGFTVQGARLYTADGHSYYYPAAEIYHPSGSIYWRLAVGDTITGYTRHIRWFIQANANLADGNYSFGSVPYWLEEGATQSGAAKTTIIQVRTPDTPTPTSTHTATPTPTSTHTVTPTPTSTPTSTSTPTPPPLVEPSAPTNVQASDQAYPNKVVITWDAVAGIVDYYEIYRATTPSGAGTMIGTATGLSYDDTNIALGLTYYYTIKAVNGAGKSPASAPVEAGSAGLPVYLPLVIK